MERLPLLGIDWRVPPYDEVGGLCAHGCENERQSNENRSSATHNVASPIGRTASISPLRSAGNVPAKRPVLLYLVAEPKRWLDGRPVPRADIDAHRTDVLDFADIVTGDEVAF